MVSADIEDHGLLPSASDSDEVRTRGRSTILKIVSGLSASLLLGMAAGTWYGTHRAAMQSDIEESVELAAVDTNQPLWQMIPKERDLCSASTDDCMSTKCCKTAGFHCLKSGETTAKCARYCPKGKQCTVLTNQMTFDTAEHKSMFCFAVYTKNHGGIKKSHEKELLEQQYAKKVSIFACDAYDVYSDVEVSLGAGLTTIKVEDVDGDWHFARRKISKAWVNSGMFMQVWKAIGKAGRYSNFDWTVKVDPDAVFFPQKLVQRIHLLPVPPAGAFLQNCQKVDYGFFGNLEVFSKAAFSILIANVDKCKTSDVHNWKIGVKGGKYGPMGEDLFAELCLRKNGVTELEAFDITTDGACPAKRPADQRKNKKWHADCSATSTPAIHPFKKPEAYFECMDAAKNL